MGAAITFDTLKFAKKLKSVGFDEAQAETLSDAFRESEAASIENLATKQDLRELETRLTGEIKALDAKMSGEQKLIRWMMGFVLAGIAALILKSFFA